MAERDEKGRFIKGHVRTLKSRKKQSQTNKKKGLKPPSPKGRKLSQETIEKIRKSHTGRKVSKSARLKMSKARKGRFKGENNPFWKGGIAQRQSLIRGTWKYREWRDLVLSRDNYKCTKCGDDKTELHVHHLYSFGKLLRELNIKTADDAIICERLWNINDGLTLCKKCHYTLHTK